MATAQKRCISFLLVLVLAFGMIPTAYATEAEAADSTESTLTTVSTEETTVDTTPAEDSIPTEPKETTAALETTIFTESTVPAEVTIPDSTLASETIPVDTPMPLMSANDGIATIAEAEIIGAPNAFANLTLPNGGIDIPAQGYMQHKRILPLYSLYLSNQTGYANNYYVAYCIEPGVELGGGGHDGTAYTINDMVDGSGALYRINRDQVKAIGIALLYGQKDIASKKDDQELRYEKLCRHAATQAIVWEIACGWRSPYAPYTLWDTTLFDAITPSLYCASSVWGTTFYLDGMDDAYLDIQAKMAQHRTIPSFAQSAKSSAITYDLTPNSSGKYSVTLTDTNNILSQFTFQNTDNLTFSKSGNKLTITANGPLTDTLVTPVKSVPSLDNQVFFVWENGKRQKMMSCKTDMVYENLPAYFKVKATAPTGSLNLTKTTEDGKNLSGWKFGVYSDSACKNLISGPHTTNSTGALSVPNLTAGTVYVKELGHTDAAIATQYTCSSTNPQKVTITGGATSTVHFHNRLKTGSVKLVKETNTGKNLDGWKIGLYTDSACTKPVSGSPFTTGSDGSITVPNLPVGALYAREIAVNDPYWVCDTSVKTVHIMAGQTATATFRNTHYGDLRIQKNAVNGSAEGWSFQILDYERNPVATIKTGADGYAHSGLLLPGKYFVLEVHDRDDTYWEYDTTVEKQVTVTAGSQTEEAFTNTLYGKIQIQKAMETDGSVKGWQFRITDSSGAEIAGSPFTTDESGLILTGKLQPGEYKVEELIPENSLYHCITENPQTVTVKPGETAQVSFTNALRPGKITIEKVDIQGEPLAGAKFLLEWSEDGSLWWPVEYTDSETVTEGRCFNPDLEDGCLTSGKDGLLEWTGLHPGLMYRVTELEAPDGYSLLTEAAFEGTLPADDLTVSFQVVNCESFKLPQTGSESAAFLRIARLLCVILCAILLTVSYRKERRK